MTTKRYSRRAFLATAGVAGAATVLGGPGTALGAAWSGAGRTSSVGSRTNTKAVAALSSSVFVPLVGSKLRMKRPGATQAVVLESVDALPGRSSDGRFSLMLRGSRSNAWAQGVYVLAHRSIGEASLLVVPVDRGVKARRYQVIVDRG